MMALCCWAIQQVMNAVPGWLRTNSASCGYCDYVVKFIIVYHDTVSLIRNLAILLPDFVCCSSGQCQACGSPGCYRCSEDAPKQNDCAVPGYTYWGRIAVGSSWQVESPSGHCHYKQVSMILPSLRPLSLLPVMIPHSGTLPCCSRKNSRLLHLTL